MWRGRFSQIWVTQTQWLALALMTSVASAAQAYPTEPETLLPTWDRSLTLKTAGGYKDNVGLSHSFPESSALFRSTLEAVATQLPVDADLFSFVLTGEDTRYPQSKNVDHEDFLVARGEYRHFWANDWQAALALEGLYLDQVLDLSVTQQRTNAFPVRGGGISARPSARRDLSADIWLTLEAGASRNLLNPPLDDFWDVGPKIILGRTYGNGSEMAASYEFVHRGYDSELARDASGVIDTNQPSIRQAFLHEVAGVWKHYWDADGHWRSTTKIGYQHSADHFSGYFDYERYQLGHQVRFRWQPWEISVEGRLTHYDFPVQTVGGEGTPKRRRSEYLVNVRAERSLGRHLRLMAEYDYEHTDSNLAVDQYAVNTVSAGVGWEF